MTVVMTVRLRVQGTGTQLEAGAVAPLPESCGVLCTCCRVTEMSFVRARDSRGGGGDGGGPSGLGDFGAEGPLGQGRGTEPSPLPFG